MKAAALGLLSRRLALQLLSCAPLAAPPVLRAFAAESEQTPSEGFITPSGLRLFDFQTGLSAWSHSVPSWCHSLGSGRLGPALLRALKRRASAAQLTVAADGSAVSQSRRHHRPLTVGLWLRSRSPLSFAVWPGLRPDLLFPPFLPREFVHP